MDEIEVEMTYPSIRIDTRVIKAPPNLIYNISKYEVDAGFELKFTTLLRKKHHNDKWYYVKISYSYKFNKPSLQLFNAFKHETLEKFHKEVYNWLINGIIDLEHNDLFGKPMWTLDTEQIEESDRLKRRYYYG